MISIKSVVSWFSSFFAASVLVALIIPAYTDFSSREESLVMIKHLEKIQEDIELRIKDHGFVASKKNVSEQHESIGKILISSDGIIISRGAKRGQIIILIPAYENGKITWRCIGGSFKDVPYECRNI